MATQVVTSEIRNITEYPNSFKRQGAFPLERYSLFNSLEDAKAYVASNPIAYIGQMVTVAIPADPENEIAASVKSYIIGADQQLHELALQENVPEGGGGEGGASEARVEAIEGKLDGCAEIEMPDRETMTMDELWIVINKLRKQLGGVDGE